MSPQPAADHSVNGWNAAYLDALYEAWRRDPGSVDPRWIPFFHGFDLGAQRAPAEAADVGPIAHTGQAKVDSLIYHYRDIGHLTADLDPLGTQRPFPAQLELASFGLNDADLDRSFDPGHLPLPHPSTLRDIIAHLRATYCGTFAIEYMHIQDRERRRWLQQHIEPDRGHPDFTTEERRRILSRLVEADVFETFLDTRFRGKKRFGVDGGESLIAIMREFVDRAPGAGIQEYAVAMAHRGRLNVLVNVLRKTYRQMFTEFEEAWTDDFLEGGGDVKYHRGYSGILPTFDGGSVKVSLSPNPSHLEFANSVVLGRIRAKQRLRRDHERKRCVPILVHGDAAFPGQGVVAECFNMMRLDGYTVGGAIHVIVNNQVGFTTNPIDSFSGRYCTDMAKMADAPIFHVNGDDPEACVFAARVALDFRQRFGNDVVIDMWCYRRLGHNEGDEPTFTQPVMYRHVREQVPVLKRYADRLVEAGVLTDADFEAECAETRTRMDEAQTSAKGSPIDPNVPAFKDTWYGLVGSYNDDPVPTGATRESLRRVSVALGTVPEGFQVHRKLERLLEYRRTAVEQEQPVDWGLAEMLAYGTLILEGHPVRLTGQDVERGTFSHRHAVLFDQETGAPYAPLDHIDPAQAKMCVHNSPLTEAACLGFEYGYSLGDPNMLVIWEAQFGDFANGAQVIFDQFIASAEVKWKRHSGIAVFLPHGYEGQGPEHSSARLERFLTLCAGDDMQVVYPTTPGQMFHLLRRQMKRNFRKPLVVMTPKSLLRNPEATTAPTDLVGGTFQHVIDDAAATDPSRIRRVVLCSGKVYYDLAAHRASVKRDDVAIVRVEQLFPLDRSVLAPILERYGVLGGSAAAAPEVVWVQEEPKNMGAYRHMDQLLREQFDLLVPYIGREAAASPAVGSSKLHAQQQHHIMVNAIGLESNTDAAREAATAHA